MLFRRWRILFTCTKQVGLDLLSQHGHNSQRIHHTQVFVNLVIFFEIDLEI